LFVLVSFFLATCAR